MCCLFCNFLKCSGWWFVFDCWQVKAIEVLESAFVWQCICLLSKIHSPQNAALYENAAYNLLILHLMDDTEFMTQHQASLQLINSQFWALYYGPCGSYPLPVTNVKPPDVMDLQVFAQSIHRVFITRCTSCTQATANPHLFWSVFNWIDLKLMQMTPNTPSKTS